MHNNNKQHRLILRRSLLATAIMMAAMPAAQAIEVDTGSEDWAIRFDNTVKYNYGVRTESADKRMLNTPNNNDGDYNFRKAGTNITNRVDLLTEMDVVYQQSMGFRVSAASWYDKAYDNVGSNSNFDRNTGQSLLNGNGAQTGFTGGLGPYPAVGNGSSHLSNYAQRYYSGPSGEILDAFVFYSTEVGDESLLSVKLGQHNVFWGETILNPVHSISYGQSGLDLAKLAASPGTEAKELFVPREQISTTFTVNQELTLGAQYFFKWDAARLPEAGTYYGGSDLVGEGAQAYLLGFTRSGQAPGLPLVTVRRGEDLTPDDKGDFGLMAKWSPEWLDGTLGFYYRRTADMLPQGMIDAKNLVNAPGLGGLSSLPNVNYFFGYGEDIDIFGLSLSKDVAGVSVGSDLNVRHNMPLSSIPMAVGAFLPGLPYPETGAVSAIPGHSYSATGDTLHWTINGLMTIADTPLFDSATLLGELYYSNLLELDSTNAALYKGDDKYRGIDKADRDNVGIAVNFTPTWYQVMPGVDLSAPMSINMGIDGTSPVQGGGAADTGNYAVGLSAAIYNQYYVDLKYVDAFGKTDKCENRLADGPNRNPLTPNVVGANYSCWSDSYSAFSGGGANIEDRGAVYLTMKTTF